MQNNGELLKRPAWFLSTIQKQTTRTNSLVLMSDWVKEEEDEETEAQHHRGQGKEKRREKRW